MDVKKAAIEPKAGEKAALPTGLFEVQALEGAIEVAKAKEDAKEGDIITVRGQIGGLKRPFVEGRAMMTVSDMSAVPCTTCGCETPWDMCCHEGAIKLTMSVQVSDESGKPLKLGLKGKGDLLPLAVVVVKGRVGARPDKNTLVLNAEKMFVEKKGILKSEDRVK